MELATGGEIYEYLKFNGPFEDQIVRYYFRGLIFSLEYLHSQGYAHRDIKPENILLNEKYQLLLADFGFAGLLEGKDGDWLMKTNLGTNAYKAPELHQKQAYDGAKADIFSAGIMLFIFKVGYPPFSHAIPSDPYYKCIHLGNFEKFWRFHAKNKPANFYDDNFKKIIEGMLDPNPGSRASISELKDMNWFNLDTATEETVFNTLEEIKLKVDKKLKRSTLSVKRAEVEALSKDSNLSDGNRCSLSEGNQKKKKKRGFGLTRFLKGLKIKFRGDSQSEDDSSLSAEVESLIAAVEAIQDKDLPSATKETLSGLAKLSGFPPKVLYQKLYIYLSGVKGANLEADPKKLKILMKVQGKFETVLIKLKVKQIEDSESSAIEFSRGMGDSIAFYEQVEKIVEIIERAEQDALGIIEKNQNVIQEEGEGEDEELLDN